MCPHCRKKLSSGRTETATKNEIALAETIHTAFDNIQERQLSVISQLVGHLDLADLFSLVRLLGKDPDKSHSDLRGRNRIGKTAAKTAFIHAAEILGDWPSEFWRYIELRRNAGTSGGTKEKGHNQVVQWFRKKDRKKFEFLHRALDEMDALEWKKGRRLSERFDKNEYVTRDYAIRVMRLSGYHIQKAIDDRQLEVRVFEGERYKRTYLRRKDLEGKFQLENKVDDCCSFSEMMRTLNIYWSQGTDLIQGKILTQVSIGNRNVVFSRLEIAKLLAKLQATASKMRSTKEFKIPLNRTGRHVTPLTIADVLSAVFSGDLKIVSAGRECGLGRFYLRLQDLSTFAEKSQFNRGWVSREAAMSLLCCTPNTMQALAKAGILKDMSPASDENAHYYSWASVKKFSAVHVCTSEISRSQSLGSIAARMKMVRAGYDPKVEVSCGGANCLIWSRADVEKVFPKMRQEALSRTKHFVENLTGAF